MLATQQPTTTAPIVDLYRWEAGHYEATLDGTPWRFQVYRMENGRWDWFRDDVPHIGLPHPARTLRAAMADLLTYIREGQEFDAVVKALADGERASMQLAA